jgi:acyl carrier protein
MTEMDRYNNVFSTVMEVNVEDLGKMKYKDGKWDSVGHMILISDLEDEFGLTFESEDIIEFDSYEKGIEIMKRYGIDI